MTHNDFNIHLNQDQAALWYLGQAGYVISSCGIKLAIDPYLSDSVGKVAQEFSRIMPMCLTPEDLNVDYFITTHNHLDHLDPETISKYAHKDKTKFIAPRLACKVLSQLVPKDNVIRIDVGETFNFGNMQLEGIFALPTGADVLDTAGYKISFSNGRSLYHTSDTSFTQLLLTCAPRRVEVLMVPINGKWGNLNITDAIRLMEHIKPRYVLPNHFDMMKLNSENPETFKWFCKEAKFKSECIVPEIMKPFIWEGQS